MAKLTQDETIAAIFSYLGILVLIPMLAIKKKNDFMNFHIRQGLVLFIAEIIAMVAVWILTFILSFALFMWYFATILWTLVWLVFVIVSLIALVKALMGEKWEIPLLSEYSKKLKI
jgi:uncharacterized membrane protein